MLVLPGFLFLGEVQMNSMRMKKCYKPIFSVKKVGVLFICLKLDGLKG